MNGVKVLFIHNNYAPLGGAETHFISAIQLMRARGYQVYTFSLSASPDLLLPEYDQTYWGDRRPTGGKLLRYIFHPGVYRKLRRWVLQVQPAWVHLHVPEQPLSILLALRDQLVVHSVHTANSICTTSLLTHRDDSLPCEGGIGLKCLRHRCVQPYVLFPNWYLAKVSNYLLQRYVKAFFPPSEYLAERLRQHGFQNVSALPLFFLESLYFIESDNE